MDNRPTKGDKLAKVRFFDTLPVEILSIIDDWGISFEYNDTRISVVNRIIQKNMSFVSFHTQN